MVYEVIIPFLLIFVSNLYCLTYFQILQVNELLIQTFQIKFIETYLF